MIGRTAGLLLLLFLTDPAVAQDGSAVFAPCRACHALDPAAKGMPGPNLSGLLGRKIAGDPDFDYSPVLRAAREDGRVWTAEALDRFVTDPEAMFPGMWMTARPLANPAERQALVRFLTDPKAR